VAVKVVPFTQVTWVKAVPPREAVGEVTTVVPFITAVKSAPLMVTEVSMSLAAEAGLMALTVGMTWSARAVQVGVKMLGLPARVGVTLSSVAGWALVVPPKASVSRPATERERRSFFMARPFGGTVCLVASGGGVRLA
jgi:hypothetical protein